MAGFTETCQTKKMYCGFGAAQKCIETIYFVTYKVVPNSRAWKPSKEFAASLYYFINLRYDWKAQEIRECLSHIS